MRKLLVSNGNWTDNGNFSGYTASGERVHIYTRQLEALGLKKGEKVPLPLYCTAQEREFEGVDDAGQPNGEKFTRLTAGAVFQQKETMIAAIAEEHTFDLEIARTLKAAGKQAELTDIAMESLLKAALG